MEFVEYDWNTLRSMIVPIRSLVILSQSIDFYVLTIQEPPTCVSSRHSFKEFLSIRKQNDKSKQDSSIPLHSLSKQNVKNELKRFIGNYLLQNKVIGSSLPLNQDKTSHMFGALTSCTNLNTDSEWDFHVLDSQSCTVKSFAIMIAHSVPLQMEESMECNKSFASSHSAYSSSSSSSCHSDNENGMNSSPTSIEKKQDVSSELSQCVTQVINPSDSIQEMESDVLDLNQMIFI